MIIIYPMLVSQNVPTNIIPGLTKSMEKYTILYNLDDILRQANMSTKTAQVVQTVGKGVSVAGAMSGNVGASVGGAVTSALGGLMMKVSKQGKLYTENVILSETTPQDKLDAMKQQQKSKEEEKAKDELAKGPTKAHDVKIELPKFETISLEPTWLQVSTSQKGMQILGVKVIPFRLSGDRNLADMLLIDSHLKYFSYLMTKYERKLVRVLFRILRKSRFIPKVRDKTLSGDPEKDILLGTTMYGDNLMMCLSQLDLQELDIFSKNKLVQKLFKLGWTSFAINDDVNKLTTFCMKEFKGLCSVVPYNYMFSSFGKGYEKVYEDIEEVKKSASPFFSRKITNRKKVFGKSSVEENIKIDNYLNKIQE